MSSEQLQLHNYGAREDGAQSSDFDEEAQPLRHSQDDLYHDEDDEASHARRAANLRSSSPGNARYSGVLGSMVAWARGPDPPKRHLIKPILATVQESHIRLLDRLIPASRQKYLFFAYMFAWLLAFSIPLIQAKAPGLITFRGPPSRQTPTHYISCTETLWRRNNYCGLDGMDCEPFSHTTFAFQCPANCADAKVWNPHHVGAQDVVYRPLVVGGGEAQRYGEAVYRADSFICGAAIHAGVVSDADGGCGIVRLVGERDEFTGSEAHGIESVGFNSTFPKSFTFSIGTDVSEIQCHGRGFRNHELIISMVFSVVFSVFTVSPGVFFFPVFTALFAHVCFVSDPSGISSQSTNVLAELIQSFARKYLPAIFVGLAIYRFAVRKTLCNLSPAAQVEKTILWLGAAWFGTLSNYTFDRMIPIQRLRLHDIRQQPGAATALIIIVLILVSIVIQQIFHLRQEGRLPRFLALYGTFVLAICISLVLPGLELRIHHYILALLLLPGTSMQTRSSLLYQGILVGLFINGAARWGFDSVLQTPGALRGDGAFDSLIPELLEPTITMGSETSTILLSWAKEPVVLAGMLSGGISVLVNDVERYRGFFSFSDGDKAPVTNGTGDEIDSFTWTRAAEMDKPQYFRFAYLGETGSALDYSKAGIWWGNGSWSYTADVG